MADKRNASISKVAIISNSSMIINIAKNASQPFIILYSTCVITSIYEDLAFLSVEKGFVV